MYKRQVHAWENDLIVGQIESRIRPDNTGYVNLFYIAPNARRRGLGRKLNDYVIAMFSSLDVDVARLTVSIGNERAIGFYRSLGWIDLGLRLGRTDSRLFETAIKKT